MSLEEIFQTVKKIVIEQLEVEASDVTPQASVGNDLGADSLELVELVMALEKEFEIEIPDEAAEKLTTIESLVYYISEKIACTPSTRYRYSGNNVSSPLLGEFEINYTSEYEVEVIEDAVADRVPTSALGRGRMRRADCVKGLECNIPSAPGLYRFVNKETGQIEYVGQTINLRRRLQQHVSNGLLDLSRYKILYGVARPGARVYDLCDAEIRHIARHNPSLNIYRGGNGRRPNNMGW